MKFSIVVPVYNAARYLRECLDSVLAQTFTDWECICVDDGSTDGSAAILDEYAGRDQRFVVNHQQNKGEGGARNQGLKLARGEIVAWVDADDFVLPTLLAYVNAVFKSKNPEMVRVREKRFVGDKLPEIASETCGSLDLAHLVVINGRDNVRRWAIQQLISAGYTWLTFTKRASRKYDFPEQIQYSGDALYSLMNASCLNSVVQSPFVGYHYRDNPNSVMKRAFPSSERLRFFSSFEKMVEMYADIGVDKFAWMAWFQLVNWILRPADVSRADEIHQAFCRLTKRGVVSIALVPAYARPGYWLYCHFGWRLPTRITYQVLAALVKTRDSIRSVHG